MSSTSPDPSNSASPPNLPPIPAALANVEIDDELVRQQAEAYRVAGVDESEPVRPTKKRKYVYTNGDEVDGRGKAPKQASAKGKPEKEVKERKNTAVYITNLPPDTTLSEVETVFSKCGVIAEEISTRAPRIKLYTDPTTSTFKGDALVVYFRAESVQLAVQMLDDTPLRLGEGARMKVQAADWSYKAQQEVPSEAAAGESGAAGARPGKPKGERAKVIKKTQKMNSKLADWSDDESPFADLPNPSAAKGTKWDRVVILKHMFTLAELEEDPAALLDIKSDIREECEKLGQVTNVVLFDQEEEGVASVRFRDVEAARHCVRVMNGRFFGGMTVVAYVADGSEKFRRSKGSAAEEGEEGERLERFGEWLDEGGE